MVGFHPQVPQLYRRAVAVFEKSVGPEHPMTAEALAGYAQVLRKLNRKKEAAGLGQRAHSILESQGLRRGSLTVDARDLGRR